MRDSASVVIIGGGVVGASVAFHLTERGMTDVVVVDRSSLASGSTGRSAGGVRQQFSTEINCRMSIISVEKLLRFHETTGGEASFVQSGYLFLLSTAEDWALFQRNVALQRSLGIDVELLDPEGAHRHLPPMRTDDLLGATFCPTDGHADPTGVCLGYATAARSRGVEVVAGVTVTGIETQHQRVAAVNTDHGRIATPLVVNAAGPWAAQIAALASVEVPIRPYRRQLYYAERPPEIPATAPMVVEFASSMYFRPEGPGLLLGMTDRSEPSSFNVNTDDAFLAMLVERAVRRVPRFEQVELIRGWAGLYDVTPDANPIIGAVGDLEGFVMAAGFSGHGFMHSPATGQLVAELITDGHTTTLDITPFSAARFASGEISVERNVI
ncbi:MAG: hypothetical protein QOF51_415 [Chloroflexota bacterium]|nr:hypothetical protein [Chloroflexota bacterium]